jgi:hypothetical protein
MAEKKKQNSKKAVSAKKAAPVAKKAPAKVVAKQAPKKASPKAPAKAQKVQPKKVAKPVSPKKPAKKVEAPKKAVQAKSAPSKKVVKKAPAKVVAKQTPKKSTTKVTPKVVKVTPAKPAPVKKATPVKKTPAKVVAKQTPKKSESEKQNKTPKTPVKMGAEKEVKTKDVLKKSEPEKKNDKKATVKNKSKKQEIEKNETVVDTLDVVQDAKPKAESKKGKSKAEPVVEEQKEELYPILLRGGVKLAKSVFFEESSEAEEKSKNTKKVGRDLKNVEKPTSALRHKASLAEETPEELHERVLRELEEENRAFYQEIANQICTRCCINIVSPEFRVDKDMGYCEECASILKLGMSKEARQTEYNINFAKGDDDQDEDFGDGPDADDLQDSDEDFDDV